MLASLLSQPVVVGCSWAELFGVVLGVPTLIGAVVAIRKLVQCQEQGCRRLGLHPHGHLRLCGVHHPLVPDDGKVTPEHVAETTTRLEA